jgi:glyoxylase-like metal-dependent hydrolase (beta-lactamase superfamily II)
VVGAPKAIHHLNCGTMCPRGARMLTGQGSLLGAARLVCHCLLLECSDGLVLVDTGFGADDVRNPGQLGRPFNLLVRPQLQEAETALAQIGSLGFQAADVRHVVTTHLDLDHAGGLPDFPDAQVHLLGRELKAAMHPSLRDRQRYVAAHWSHNPKWVEHEVGGDDWFGFQSVRVLPGSDEEILLIPLPGHSLGHAGVAVRTGERWLLHCGDAYFNQGEMQTPPHCPLGMRTFEAMTNSDTRTRLQNQERLRELAREHFGEVELICSHDPGTLESA